jgi:Skp family chaperone for outer membrane proteins
MLRSIITTAFILLLSVSSVFGQRVGFAEPQLILDALPDRERIETALEQFYIQWEEEYNIAYERYSEELFLFEQNRADLSQRQLQSEQLKLAELAEELQLMQQEFGIQFEQRRAELTAPVVEKINTAIRTVAQELNLDFVFNSETTEGDPLIFIIRDNPNSINITNRVVELLR